MHHTACATHVGLDLELVSDAPNCVQAVVVIRLTNISAECLNHLRFPSGVTLQSVSRFRAPPSDTRRPHWHVSHAQDAAASFLCSPPIRLWVVALPPMVFDHLCAMVVVLVAAGSVVELVAEVLRKMRFAIA